MSDTPKKETWQAVEPTDRLNYLCDISREILLRVPAEAKIAQVHTWRSKCQKKLFELSAMNLLNSPDPTFSLKAKVIASEPTIPSSGDTLYMFNKRSGITFQSPIGTQITHNANEDPIVRNLLGFVRPELRHSDVYAGNDVAEMRHAFDGIAGQLALQHLYGTTSKPRLRQYLDQLAQNPDEVMFQEIRDFIDIDRRQDTFFAVRDDVFDAALREIATTGIPPEWRGAIKE